MRTQLLLLLLSSVLLTACTLIDPVTARTQVTLRVASSDEELLAQMDALRVAVRLDEGGRWRDAVSQTFAVGQLHWPVDIPVTPRLPAESNSQFEVVVDALRAGTPIVQTRMIARFVEGEKRVEELELYLCRNDQGISVCADESCVGLNCRVCSKTGTCDLVSMSSEPPVVVEMDTGTRSDAALQHDGGDADSAPLNDATVAMNDAQAGPVTAQYALGVVGTSCSANLEQSTGCEGHASQKVLQCQQGIWRLLQTCGPSEGCESRTGTGQGTCAVIPAACVGKMPGEICDGTARLECGIDLVNVTSKPCPERTHCDASAGTKCVCDAGYEPDGQGGCRNPDDCPANACSGGRCVDGLGSWSCDCNQGFTGTGTKACTAVLYCPKDACSPGGSCVDTMDWSCQCATGFSGTGTRACANTNDCPSDRCRAPNGVCADLISTYRCDCNTGFSGTDCVNDICNPNPCRNGGACSRTGTLCTCQPGYSGTNCQTDICSPNPCLNGGTCSRAGTLCSCPVGYSGTNCQVDACSPNPCLNNGACVREASGTSCNCASGWQGARCDTRIDPCNGTKNACGGSCMTSLAHAPGEPCSNGLKGACARTGAYQCQGTTATVCSAPSISAGTEVCEDNVDNDCDGSVDEGDAIDHGIWYQDCDDDGYAGTISTPACKKPAPTGSCANWLPTAPGSKTLDCDDRSATYNPGIIGSGYPQPPNPSADLNCDGKIEYDDHVLWGDFVNPSIAFLCATGLDCGACWTQACAEIAATGFHCIGAEPQQPLTCGTSMLVRTAHDLGCTWSDSTVLVELTRLQCL